MSIKIVDSSYVIFDLETTGLSPKTEQIIEIAARKVNFNGELLGEFHGYVNLYKVNEISDFIKNLTKINADVLAQKGEDITDVMDNFLEFCDQSVLVAQNKKFDIGFLMEYFLEERGQVFSQICVDTIDFAKAMYPGQPSYKLQSLCEMYECDYDSTKHHQAMYDVIMTERIFLLQLTGLFSVNSELADFLEFDGQGLATSKQMDYLMSLLGKKGLGLGNYDFVNKFTASKLIDFLIKN